MTLIRQACEQGGWETAGRPPHPALAPFVRRGYVGYRESQPPPRRREVAYDAIVVVLNLGSPIAVDGWGPGGSFVAGLHDQPHFNREFRELAGVTPGGYLAAQLPGLGGVAA